MKKVLNTYNVVKQFLFKPLKQCGTFFVFTLLMCYIIAIVGNMLGGDSSFFLSFLLPIFDCYIVCVIAWLLKKVYLHWIWYLVIGFLLYAELFTEFYYHSDFSVFVLQLILETSTRECSEFVSSAFFLPIAWYAAGLTICASGLAFAIRLCSHFSFKYRSLVIFTIFTLIVWSGIRRMSDYCKLYRCFASQTFAECIEKDNNPHQNSTFIRILYGTAFNMASSAELSILEETVASTTVDSCTFQSPLIVLVIGESFNKYHSSLYGYHLSTSPRLDKKQSEGNLYLYNDVVSPFNLTSYSFEYMFTTWDEECDDSWLQHPLFPAIFKKAGYKVYFITNQFTIKEGGFHDAVGGTILNRPILSDLQFTGRNNRSYYYDDELLSEIPPIDSLAATPTLLIFHVNGQHQDYAEKYPNDFSRFTIEDERTPFGGDKGKQIAAHYDNATYYNDYVVDSLLNIIKDTEAIAIYLSDHGEEVYDWRDQFQRSSEANMPAEVARYQYEIPFMIYMTDLYISRHSDIVKSVQESTNRPFISTDLCHMLFHLAGIRHSDYQERKDLLSPNYDVNRKRIIRYDVDYDSLISTLKASCP